MTSGGVPSTDSWATGQASTATAARRPPQPATTVPRTMLPVAPHTPALRTRPPSRGSPGTRLRTPTSRLAPARPSMARRVRPSGVTGSSSSAATPTAIEVSGPTTAMKNSSRGRFASPSIEVMPPRKCRVIELTG